MPKDERIKFCKKLRKKTSVSSWAADYAPVRVSGSLKKRAEIFEVTFFGSLGRRTW